MKVQKMPSSKAQDRSISQWFHKIQNGEIKLPRFQRHQAWDRKRICSLLDTVIQNLPLGVTLILDVDNEKFISRYLVTAPETGTRVTEHLLDGQQRLTSLWRTLHNNYEWEKYFVYFSKYDQVYEVEDLNEVNIYRRTRWQNKKGIKMPLWADSPDKTFFRGLIPLELFRPGDIFEEYQSWVDAAMKQYKPEKDEEEYEDLLYKWMEEKRQLLDDIRDIRETITHFNLPFLALPSATSKETALQVFINMNSNSKPLSQYDIIRAEIEEVSNESLDDLENQLISRYRSVPFYERTSYLILATSALLQDKLPNQRGMWDMDKEVMVRNWNKMEFGLDKMSEFLENEGIYDRKRLPTNAILAVLAALFNYFPDNVDEKGIFYQLIRKYVWRSFFTDRYENSAASNAFFDFIGLKRILTKEKKENGDYYAEKDVPVLNDEKHELADLDELIKVGWPKRENIRGRAIMAISYKLGAYDFADGSKLNRSQLLESKRQYHHIFPDSLIKHLDVNPNLALNCSLISDRTNLNISNKEPLIYLKERYKWMDQEVVNTRLKSHLIPIKELENGGYENLSEDDKDQKLIKDYQAFINRRAAYMIKAAEYLCQGKEISASEIINEVEKLETTSI
ncbi:DUF262 domain-containing protein [Aquimarina aggregata]|uniref:DUF262 domain-containing protein n=1 Tax=Aquimarina aggregata TaxID=1642818 RepID=UPI0024910F5C|nr:DUF262 domain-containing protein [Aquimarina aggregata]